MLVSNYKSPMEVLYMSIIRLWLLGILIIIPFITKIQTIVKPWNNEWAALLNRVDEGTIIIFFLLAIRELYVGRKNSKDNEYC